MSAKLVMPGLVPGIHVLTALQQERRDGRDKPGHDEDRSFAKCGMHFRAYSQHDNHAGSSYPTAVSISIVRRTAARAIMRA